MTKLFRFFFKIVGIYSFVLLQSCCLVTVPVGLALKVPCKVVSVSYDYLCDSGKDEKAASKKTD